MTLLVLILVYILILVINGRFLNINTIIHPDTNITPSIIIPYNNSSENVSPTASAIGAPPASACVLYDTFSTVNSNWTKRSQTWGNGFVYVTFVPSNVWVSDGNLQLRSYVENNTGCEYKSDDSFLYGKYRASIRIEQTEGTFGSIFSYMWPTGGNRQGHNEIDIEFNKVNGSTTIMLSNFVNYVKDHHDFVLSFDPSTDYHVYGYDWYPDRVEYYIDDMSKPVWVSYKNVPQAPMYLYFQLWTLANVPADYGDGVNTEYVDWVTVEPIP